ncbi:MAG: cupin domain-containing protein [Acidimicrobiia bacterium]
MREIDTGQVERAEVVLPCDDLNETLAFYVERLGFRVDLISPADDPRVAVISGHGVRLRLQRGGSDSRGRIDREGPVDAGTLRLVCHAPETMDGGTLELTAPNGTRIQLVDADSPLVLPPLVPSFVVSRIGNDPHWGAGRAGMGYRDLIPDRQGGRFIASHIRIADGGPVPDYVHFHKIRFQLIYCYRGWARLVYEDQGEPFLLRAGDCVLQPPEIRHRVLESSDGLEVIEIGCPARHDTLADHELPLPTPDHRPDRDFGGQRFVRHEVARATWQPWRLDGFACRDTGIAAATDGLAGVRVVRPTASPTRQTCTHGGELLFLFVLEGAVTLGRDGGEPERLGAGDAVVVPAGLSHWFADSSSDLELLEVTLPAVLGHR